MAFVKLKTISCNTPYRFLWISFILTSIFYISKDKIYGNLL